MKSNWEECLRSSLATKVLWISKSQNGTWRAKPASCDVSASILRWCFRGRKQGATSNQPQMPPDSKKRHLKLKKLEICQNSKMLKTEKFYKLGPKMCTTPHPRFLEGKTRATRRYSTRLGLPLNYSWTQRTLLHQTHNCGYCTYMVQNWHFSIFCHLLLNFLSC